MEVINNQQGSPVLSNHKGTWLYKWARGPVDGDMDTAWDPSSWQCHFLSVKEVTLSAKTKESHCPSVEHLKGWGDSSVG